MVAQTGEVFGFGSSTSRLSSVDLSKILYQSLSIVESGACVLAVVPDRTRDDNTHILFPLAAEILAAKNVAKLDILIAQGTHAPMSAAEKLAKIGISTTEELSTTSVIYDHEWDNRDELISIGELSSERVAEITGGLLDQPIELTINKRISSEHYDHILIFGATSPHEVAGFSAGAKYFFPGVSGAALTNATHWLGALAGIENTIGRIETPTRHMIEAAADHIVPPVTCFTSVCSRDESGELATHAMFGGDMRLSVREAAAVSREVHIKYVPRKYKRVVALLDEHYDELWTGGKASYKLGGIIEEGGELIIYAPHLRCASDTHGAVIEKYGYAPIEKVKEMVARSDELRANLCVAAHLAHVAFAGSVTSAGMLPRYKISLASQIDEETCRTLNLNYVDPRAFELEEHSKDPDTLVVKRAGLELYLVKPH